MTKKGEDVADTVSELLELANHANLPQGSFDNDVEDGCREEAKLKAKTINEGSLMGQLEYLLERGYWPGRLKEMIREYSKK